MKILVEVSDDTIRGLISGAHCRNWCSALTPGIADPWRWVACERGDSDIPTPTYHIVDRADIERALAILAARAPRRFGDLLAGNADGVTGDLILQYAIWGENKYV